MRFNKTPIPKRGDTKTKTKFAFLPTKVKDSANRLTYTVLFETYYAVYRYEDKWILTAKLINNGL